MSLTLSSNCSVCGTKANVSKCAACKVTFYCGRGHQVSDRPEHKGACNAVKRALVGLENQEAKLRATPGDFMTPPGATIFEEHAGHFWGINQTRPYMQARYALVEALLKIKTYAAVEAALNHLLDMLRLCRGDNMGVRDVVPALFLRLGRDQECYDFVKWWATTGERGNYDWGDMDEPYLDLKDENPFEAPGLFTQKFAAHGISVTLLKIRILFDCRALKSAAVIGEKVPQEVLDNIYNQMVGTIVAQRQDIMDGKDLDPLIEDLQTQVSDMYHAVNNSNKYFWSALLRPGANLTARPGAYSKGSEAEMQLMLQYSYNSWAETPGAINYIRALVTNRNC
ncbi:hypothetical protein ACLOAV_004490 [Pseudogymnoascus australis]